MMLSNFQRRILRIKSSRENLFILGVVSCLIIYCGNQFFKIKELQRNIEMNYDVDEMELPEQVNHTYSEYRLFQSAEAAEFPNVLNGIPRIPHIIHQICDSEEVLNLFFEPMRSFVENNPTWEYRFWTYESGRNFLKKHYPYLVRTYDQFDKDDVKKADVLRYAVIYEYGGVYADLDVKNWRSLNIATLKYACIVPTEPFEHSALIHRTEVTLSTVVLLCRPKHPFFQQLLLNLQFANRNGNPVITTGPLYVTKVYMLYNNITEADLRKSKTDNSSNSPYFYKGTRQEDDDDAVYIPNSQYFMDDVDGKYITYDGSLSTCINKPSTKYTQRDLELYNRGCNEFENRKSLRSDRTFTFTHHYWFHLWSLNKDILYMVYGKNHIKDIIPNCILFSK